MDMNKAFSTVELPDKLRAQVAEVMTRDVKFVTPDTLMTEVAGIFESSNFHHLPVLDNEGVVVGMISKLDYNLLLSHYTIFKREDIDIQNKKYLGTLIAEEVMTGDPVCIHYSASIQSASQVFLENLFRAMPVVDDKICVGIITPFDILRFLTKEPELLDTE